MFKKVKKYFDDKKAEKERLEEEERIRAAEAEAIAKEKAKKRREEKERKRIEAQLKADEEARLAKQREDEEAAEKARKAYIAKLEKDKAVATEKGEPWVALVTMDVDFENLNNGAFELDWNDAFVARLMRFGYQGKTDADLVDQWFTDVCKNVVLETYEQAQADLHPVKKQDLGDGRREYK